MRLRTTRMRAGSCPSAEYHRRRAPPPLRVVGREAKNLSHALVLPPASVSKAAPSWPRVGHNTHRTETNR
jgi:hypothetical protein